MVVVVVLASSSSSSSGSKRRREQKRRRVAEAARCSSFAAGRLERRPARGCCLPADGAKQVPGRGRLREARRGRSKRRAQGRGQNPSRPRPRCCCPRCSRGRRRRRRREGRSAAGRLSADALLAHRRHHHAPAPSSSTSVRRRIGTRRGARRLHLQDLGGDQLEDGPSQRVRLAKPLDALHDRRAQRRAQRARRRVADQDPRVRQRLPRARALLRVFLQQQSHEILGLVRDGPPGRPSERRLLRQDALPDHGQRRRLGARGVVKGKAPAEQLVGHHSGRPHVCLGAHSGRQDLRGHEPWRAFEPKVRPRQLRGVEKGREAEVDRLERRVWRLGQEHKVSRFDVPVEDPVGVALGERAQHGAHEGGDGHLGVVRAVGDGVEELAAAAELL